MGRSRGRPRGRDWYRGRDDLEGQLMREARAIVLAARTQGDQPQVTLRAVALRLGRGLRTVQDAMALEDIGWAEIRAAALRGLNYPHITRTLAA